MQYNQRLAHLSMQTRLTPHGLQFDSFGAKTDAGAHPGDDIQNACACNVQEVSTTENKIKFPFLLFTLIFSIFLKESVPDSH